MSEEICILKDKLNMLKSQYDLVVKENEEVKYQVVEYDKLVMTYKEKYNSHCEKIKNLEGTISENEEEFRLDLQIIEKLQKENKSTKRKIETDKELIRELDTELKTNEIYMKEVLYNFNSKGKYGDREKS